MLPTDTLVALAAKATNADAVARLLRTKGRSETRRLSVAVSSTEELERWGELHEVARRFVRAHLPGPFTVLLRPSARARATLAPAVVGGPLLGLRVPAHPLARELARREGPITATSANRSGRPASRSVAEARRALGRAAAYYVDGPPAPSGVPSRLVDLSGRRPVALRRR